ncbi:hypothetical protein D3C87_1807140 [compost metagenome]
MPRNRITSNRPASTAICGNMDTARIVISSRLRPRNRTRLRAKDAVIARNNARMTVTLATKTELSRLRGKAPWLNTCRKLSRLNEVGQ